MSGWADEAYVAHDGEDDIVAAAAQQRLHGTLASGAQWTALVLQLFALEVETAVAEQICMRPPQSR